MTEQPTYRPVGSSVASLADKLGRRNVTTAPTTATRDSTPAPVEPPTEHPPAAPAVTVGGGATIDVSQVGEGPLDQSSTATDLTAPRAAAVNDPALGARRQISFATPVAIRHRLREYLAAAETTLADAIMTAIENAYPRIDELLTGHRPVVHRGPLFTRARSTPDRTDHVQVSLRLPSDAISTIDRLAAEHGAANRSQLITVALDAYLPGEPRTEQTVPR